MTERHEEASTRCYRLAVQERDALRAERDAARKWARHWRSKLRDCDREADAVEFDALPWAREA